VTPNDFLSQEPDAQAALNLRPLSIGELLDRAFNLYFRHVAVFTALIAIVIVPSIVISYFQSAPLLNFYINMVQHQIQQPNSTPDISKLAALQPSTGWLAIQWAIIVLGFPFAYGAVIAGVSRAYMGLPVTIADCYRYSLRRWLPMLILIVLWLFAAFAIVLVLAFCFALVIGIATLFAKGVGHNLFFSILAVILAIAASLTIVGVGIVLYLTSAVSFIAVVVEDVDPIKAFSSSFARMFGANQFWRGFVLALALTGINIGAQLVGSGGGALLAFVFKAPALYLILTGMTSLFFAPFAVVTAAVFYYDIRVRREGYDLQLMVQRFLSGPVPAPPTG
jgi:hypothetical protein